ncbi:MAG TPA: hypothetical protein VLG09_01405 [Candidatus Saccharimonadales bacterium]|nr:hypothetical protein [Candidatus Saccharimonadales bacterium]
MIEVIQSGFPQQEHGIRASTNGYDSMDHFLFLYISIAWTVDFDTSIRIQVSPFNRDT